MYERVHRKLLTLECTLEVTKDNKDQGREFYFYLPYIVLCNFKILQQACNTQLLFEIILIN